MFYLQLYGHIIARHGATKVTLFDLVYRQGVMLPIEVNLGAYIIAKKKELSTVMYPTKDRLELLEHTIRNSKASHFKLDIYC